MRDAHLKSGHSHAADPAPPERLEDEELQPFMFDLIETDRVDILKSLIPRLRNLKPLVQIEVAIHAAKTGSHSILQLFNDSGLLTGAFVTEGIISWKHLTHLARSTIRSESVSFSKILLCWVATLNLRLGDMQNFQLAVKDIFATLMELESENLFELWRPILASGFGITGTGMEVAQVFAFQGAISSTENVPSRERMLLGIWEEYKVLDTIKARERHRILPSIADSSCCINLARYAIQHGCGVDTQSSYNSLTALQVASRKTTQEAAYLMEFLLLQGADPNKRTAKRRIGDEKGAQGISKWLGLTWEQLVESTAEERQRNKKDENEGSSSG
jgi:hypothetical protein